MKDMSSPSKGPLNKLKNKVLFKYVRKLKLDKFVTGYWRALQGTAKLASAQFIDFRLSNFTNIAKSNNKRSNSEAHPSFDLGPDDLQGIKNYQNEVNKKESILVEPVTEFSLREKENLYNNKEISDSISTNVQSYNKDSKIKLFLINGSKFQQPHLVNGRSIIVKNTCPFDSIAQILATAVIDSKLFMEYMITRSRFVAMFAFVLLFTAVGDENEVYVERCILLMDKFFQTGEHIVNSNILENSPAGQLCVVDAYTFVSNMWSHLMKDEASMKVCEKCKEGHEYVINSIKVYINENLIREKGYKSLEEAIILTPNNTSTECKQEGCGSQIIERKVHLNVQLFIELDVRYIEKKTEKEDYGASILTCLPAEIPASITLENQNFRLSGIVVYEENHFIALCRRLNGIWYEYNDLLNGKVICKLNKSIKPQACIYIKTVDNKVCELDNKSHYCKENDF